MVRDPGPPRAGDDAPANRRLGVLHDDLRAEAVSSRVVP